MDSMTRSMPKGPAHCLSTTVTLSRSDGPLPHIGDCNAIEGPHLLDHVVIIHERERPIDGCAIAYSGFPREAHPTQSDHDAPLGVPTGYKP
jgi:hypothetical protein